MKIHLILLAFFILSPLQHPKKLQGIYRVEYDKNDGKQLFQITFSDSTFVKKMPDAVTSRGKIAYGKFKTTFKKDGNDDPIEIDNRDIGKDTIKFSLKNKTDNSRIVAKGKFIRLK